MQAAGAIDPSMRMGQQLQNEPAGRGTGVKASNNAHEVEGGLGVGALHFGHALDLDLALRLDDGQIRRSAQFGLQFPHSMSSEPESTLRMRLDARQPSSVNLGTR